MTIVPELALLSSRKNYNRFLLLVAGLGGLLYGVDAGLITGAKPYLEAASRLNAGQISGVMAAMLLGGALSTLFAGTLADWMGRKPLLTLGGALFVAGAAMIALAQDYGPLLLGWLLQGLSAGLIGVVVPLYLAECLGAAVRGSGMGIFQWLIALGFVAAAVNGIYYNHRAGEVWRGMLWVSLLPGILFVTGSLMLTESPRWLYWRGRQKAACAALLRSRNDNQADLELEGMRAMAAAADTRRTKQERQFKDTLFHRHYLIPFALACVILACNQATGVNSIIGCNTGILLQGGLSDVQAHWAGLIFTVVNFLATIGAIALVDRKGRKFLLALGCAGIIASLLCAGILFSHAESRQIDCKEAVQGLVSPDQTLALTYNDSMARGLLSPEERGSMAANQHATTLIITYSCGDFRAATPVVRSDDKTPKRIEITRGKCVPGNKTAAFFSNPLADFDATTNAPLKIDSALITPVPGPENGWETAFCLYLFIASYAIGPGVCVWLALSELMPTRIRASGMSIALIIQQTMAAAITAKFLPTAGQYGYSMMFFAFAGCTIIYLLAVVFFLPETKGKTLEEIEEYFEEKETSRPAAR